MAASCELLLLGPPEVRLESEVVRIRQRDRRALLFFLASQGGMVPQEEVFLLIWEGQAGENLQRQIKRAQEGLRRDLAGMDILQIEENLIGLNFSQVSVDLHEFQNLVDRAGSSPWQPAAQGALIPEAFDLLSAAAELWRGPHFLEGISLPRSPRIQKWFQETSRKVENLRGRIFERLAHHHAASQNLEEALRLARQALDNLPLNEDLHFLTMQSLVNLNRIEEARSHFERLQRVLQHELDTAPSPRLIDLYRKIRAGTIRHTHPFPTSRLKLRPGLQAPFVNRVEILEHLQRKLRKGGGVFIFGESGQGKTRLLQEFSQRSGPRSRLLVATCHPAEANLPYQPVIEILRNDLLPDEWLSFPASLVSQLTVLLPELSQMLPDLSEPVVEVSSELATGYARSFLMEAIRQVFLQLAKGHRLIFCLDDAHWSDEATLTTLEYLLERPPFTQNALMVATARQDEKNPHLAALLGSLLPSGMLDVIHLARFSAAETAELALRVLGAEPSDLFSQRLAEETGGNPLFILETLQLILERDPVPDLSGTTRFPVGGSLQALLKSRLAQLSPNAREVIEAASVLGVDFNLEAAAQVSGYPAEELSQALSELEERRLVKPQVEKSGPSKNNYSLIHPYLQEVLLQEINPLQKQLFHLRTARILKEDLRSPVSEGAAILAQHYEAAGEASLAFDHWVDAGRYAHQLFSAADAYSAFMRAERLIRTTPGLTDDQIHRLYAEWTETAYVNEDPASIRRQNHFLLEIGEQRRSPLLIGAALDGLSDACMAENQFETGLEYTERAIRYLEQSDNLFEQMEAYNHRGVFLYMLNRIDAAGEAFQDALSLGAQSDDPLVLQSRANAHFQIAFTSILKGWPGTARLHATRSLEICSSIHRAHGQVNALSALALASYFLGDFPQALEACQQGIGLASRMRAWRVFGYLHAYRAMVYLASGQTDLALQDIRLAQEQGERFNHNEISAICHRLSGDLYFLLGAADRAYLEYRQSLELSENLFLASDSRYRAGLALCLKGEMENGQLAIEKAVQDAGNSGMRLIYLLARQALTLTQLSTRDPDLAQQVTRETLQESGLRGLKSVHLWAHLKQGDIYLEQQKYGQARESLTQAAQIASEIPIPWLELSALTLQARLAQLNGEEVQPYRQRMETILAGLDSNLSQEPYRQAFLQFRERLISGS